jgi:homoserine dehydrogenase
MLYGKGAGMDPTASAIVGDVIEISRNILAGIKRRTSPLGYLEERVRNLAIKPIGETVSKYYIRFSVVDKPGVIARIAGALGRNNISIASMIQTARSIQDSVPIVIMTHEAQEMDIRQALAEIDAFDIIREKSNLIRIEDNLE